MNARELNDAILNRRGFIKAGSAGVAVAGMAMAQASPDKAANAPGNPSSNPSTRELTEKEKLARIASNTWPIRDIFKTAGGRPNPQIDAMKKKYGEITMLDFPDFTKSTFPGVYHMDLFSGLFGDVTDPTMFLPATVAAGRGLAGGSTRLGDFDPSTPSAKKWLEKMANKMAVTGTKCQHISNNAPTNICVDDVELRKQGIQVAKNWLDAGSIMGAKSMRVNSGGPRIAPTPGQGSDGYPKNDELARLLSNCIESFKEMADYGAKVGVKATLENHWGLTANPINIQIIVDEVHSPFCEASPDFFNWEHDYLCYHGLAALAPYAHTNVHAKYWNRWATCDVQRCVRIMESARFTGTYALEYEDGPWDRVEGAKYLYKEVLASL
jgi:Xylose isomerase-like TIM barrel